MNASKLIFQAKTICSKGTREECAAAWDRVEESCAYKSRKRCRKNKRKARVVFKNTPDIEEFFIKTGEDMLIYDNMVNQRKNQIQLMYKNFFVDLE